MAKPGGVYPIRGIMGNCHLLVDSAGQAVLLDTGMAVELPYLCHLLRRLQVAPAALQAILLTHGHLDHAGNLTPIKQWTGAPIYAHLYEQIHLDGRYPYTGPARWCGRLERFGRTLFRYQPATIDHALQDGDQLPFWDGLEVVHLPGHTKGHCGFYSRRHDLLFCGDLFASYSVSTHLPPPILNSHPELIPDSFRRTAALNPRRILPSHYDFCDGELHRRRFDRLYAKIVPAQSPDKSRP